MKVYEYDEILETLYRAGKTDEGVDPETGMVYDITLIDQLEMEREKKIENALMYYKQLNADVEELKTYIKSLQERQKAKENRAEGFKRWIAYTLRDDGGKPFETVKVRASATIKELEKTDITDRSKIPEEYRNYSKSWSPALDPIKEAIKSGKEVPGARLIDSITLRIK